MRIIQTLLVIVFPFIVDAQELTTNQYDDLGKKTGLWIEHNGEFEFYYINGELHGLIRHYSRSTGRLIGFGEYRNGEPVGTSYVFHDSGHLLFIMTDFKKNTVLQRQNDNGDKVTPPHTCWIKDFYPNGQIQAEGLVLYYEDPEMDSYKIGEWTYYSEDGEKSVIVENE